MEFEIDLIDNKNEALGIKISDNVTAKISINLDSIIAFRQTFLSDENADNNKGLGDHIIVYFAGEQNFHINYSYKEFKKLFD